MCVCLSLLRVVFFAGYFLCLRLVVHFVLYACSCLLPNQQYCLLLASSCPALNRQDDLGHPVITGSMTLSWCMLAFAYIFMTHSVNLYIKPLAPQQTVPGVELHEKRSNAYSLHILPIIHSVGMVRLAGDWHWLQKCLFHEAGR